MFLTQRLREGFGLLLSPVFFASDRASDQVRVFTSEVLTLLDDSQFLFPNTFGKALRGRVSSAFMIEKSCNVIV